MTNLSKSERDGYQKAAYDLLRGLQNNSLVPSVMEKLTIGVPSLSTLLSCFQAKAAVTTQLVSAQLHSHHFFPMHRKDGTGPPINDEEIDSEDDEEYDNMAGRERVYEEQNVDWFFEVSNYWRR